MDLRRLRRDPIALLVWLGIPVAVAALLSLIFGGGNGSRPALHGLLLVADEDRTAASARLTQVFGYGEFAKMISVERVGRAAGRERLDRGGASALLIIPRGFERAWREREPFEVTLVQNPSQRILPGVIEQALAAMLEIASDARTPAAGERLAALSSAAPAVLKTTVIAPEARPAVNFPALLFHGMVFMAALFMTMGLAGGVWKERAQGALRRLAASPAPVAGYLAGKSLAVGAVLAGVGVIGLAMARWLIQTPLHDPALALLWVVLSGAAMFLWFVLLQTAAGGERAAHLLSSLLTLPLIMLGGGLFPFEMMPQGLAALGRFTPNGWALTEYKAILDGSIGAGWLALDFLCAGAAAALALWLSARRLRARFLS